jgi:hypothetical protein
VETNLNNVPIFALVYLLLPGTLLLRALRFPRPAQLAAWSANYDLQLTAENRPVVVAYLRRTRRFRALPPALAWTITGLPLLTGEPLPFGVDPTSVVIYAYFTGAALAVLTMRGNHPQSRTRQARLTPRAVDDYLATHVRRLLWGTSALVLALLPTYAAVAAWARRQEGPTIGDAVVPVTEVAGVVVVALAVALVSEFAQRRLVARPQPVTSPDLIAADDALRSASVAAAAGAGVVVVAFATQIEAIAKLMETDWLRWPLHLIALGAVLLALSSFFSAFRPEPWWFGRRHGERSSA